VSKFPTLEVSIFDHAMVEGGFGSKALSKAPLLQKKKCFLGFLQIAVMLLFGFAAI